MGVVDHMDQNIAASMSDLRSMKWGGPFLGLC